LAGERLAFADLAAEYVAVFDKAARMNPLIDEGYRAVVQDAQRCYEQLRQFVTQMAALAA
jgi:hypothetical protein